eukprot:352427-Chlamydomonas_euryale.AAC.4
MEEEHSMGVHDHPDAYVRRAALLAAGQAVASLPPPRVAAALLASGGGGAGPGGVSLLAAEARKHVSGNGSGGSGGTPADEVLLSQLEWVQGWARATAERDVDATCRDMAGAVVSIQAGSAEAALAALAAVPGGGSGGGVMERLAGAGSGPGGLVGRGVRMPGAAWPRLGVSMPDAAGGPAKAPLAVEIASIGRHR